MLINSLQQNDNSVYTVKTPDSTFFSFHYLEKKEVKEFLQKNAGSYSPLPDTQLDFQQHPAYLCTDGKVIHLDDDFSGTAFLFNSINDYLRRLRGDHYYDVSIIINNGLVYTSFWLNPASGIEFFNKKGKVLDKYPAVDGFAAYLMPDNAVIFIRHRINDIYDGHWYPSIQDFEDWYYATTSDSYKPPKNVL